MRTTTAFAAALVLLAATACSAETGEEEGAPPADIAEDMDEMEAYEDEGGETTVGLSEVHDFGDGFTIAMVDLRREVEEDGFNPTTGEEGALPYAAWSFEITNNTGGTVHTGSVTSSCFTGDPLQESDQPVYGESVNPPEQLADGQSAAWDADCWLEEDEAQMQYTIQFHDEEAGELYPPVTFAGEVGAE